MRLSPISVRATFRFITYNFLTQMNNRSKLWSILFQSALIGAASIAQSLSGAGVPVLLSGVEPILLPHGWWSHGGVHYSINLADHIGIPDVTGPLVQVTTPLGTFNMELRPDVAPKHVENFLAYVDAGSYNRSIFHRNVKEFVIQGGGYYVPMEDLEYFLYPVDRIRDPVQLEYNLPNAYGTLAMARTSEPNSATSEWYINTVDNSTTLAPRADDPNTSNNEYSDGYTVFGKVIGTGMNVVEALAALETRNISGSGFTHMPLINFNEADGLNKENFVRMEIVRRATILPDGSGKASVLNLEIINTGNTFIAQPTLDNATLNFTFDPTYRGSTTIVVRASDPNGNHVDLPVKIASNASAFTLGETVPLGNDVTWSFFFSYMWEAHYPWVWMFDRNEWWYVFGPSPDNLWVWSPGVGFIWTTTSLYPWVHITE